MQKRMRMGRLPERAWLVFLCVGVAILAAYFALPIGDKARAVLDVLFSLAAVVAIGAGLYFHRPERRRPWVLYGVGMTLFLFDVLVQAYSVIVHEATEKDAGNDIFESIAYVVIITALLSLVYSRDGGDRDRTSLIDASIVVAGATMVTWVFFMAPFALDASRPLSERIMEMTYPVANLILLAVSVRLAVSRGTRTPAFFLLLLAMLASLIANTMSLEQLRVHGFVETTAPLNMIGMLATIFAGAAPLHRSMRSLTEVGHHESRLTVTRMMLFLGASATGVLTYVIERIRGNEVQVPVLLGGSLLIFLLVLVRLASLGRAMQRSEDALRASEENSRLLFESSPLPMWVFDQETLRFLAVNDAATAHYGYARDEFLTMKITDIGPPDHAKGLVDEVDRIRADGPGVERRGQWVHHVKDGRSIDVDVVSQSIDFRGRAASLVVAQDVTARRLVEREKENLEEQLRQSQKLEAVGQLAGGVAHDFNNLLAVVLNYARFVRDDMPEDSPGHEDMTQILSAANKASRLVRQLLAFSRREIVMPEVLDVNDIVSDIHRLLTRTTKESITILVDLGENLWSAEADRGQMEQILLNLAVNADAAMPDGGTLQIKTSNRIIDERTAAQKAELRAGAYVCLSVSDDGTGMSKETEAHIFEPFFTTKEVGEGSGLGLSTVYGIVKQAGGYVYVYSEEGRGTTFNIYLPATDAVPGAESRPELDLGTHNGTETILVVEDEEGVRDITQRILVAAGYEVIVAESPAVAIEMMESDRHVDLLLTDVIMPGLSGRELALKLQSERPDLKTIFMSGYTDEIIARQGILDDGVTFLQKPFGAEDLLPLITEVLGNQQQPLADPVLSVLIVDDEEPMRQVLKILLETNFRIVGEAATGQEAIELAGRLRPDLIVLDHFMPGMTGADTAPLLRQACPTSRICAFSAVLDEAPPWADAFLKKERIGELPPVLDALT